MEVNSRTKQTNWFLLSTTIHQNKIAVGSHDLVMDRPESQVSKLIHGTIQGMDMRLVLRYFKYRIENDKLVYDIAKKTIQMSDSDMYDIELQFNKKV